MAHAQEPIIFFSIQSTSPRISPGRWQWWECWRGFVPHSLEVYWLLTPYLRFPSTFSSAAQHVPTPISMTASITCLATSHIDYIKQWIYEQYAGAGGFIRKCKPAVTFKFLWQCNSNNNTEGYKLMTMKSGSNLSHSLSGGWETNWIWEGMDGRGNKPQSGTLCCVETRHVPQAERQSGNQAHEFRS